MESLESHTNYWPVNSDTVENVHVSKVGQYAKHSLTLGDMNEDQLWMFMKKRLDLERNQGKEPLNFYKDRLCF